MQAAEKFKSFLNLKGWSIRRFVRETGISYPTLSEFMRTGTVRTFATRDKLIEATHGILKPEDFNGGQEVR